MGYQDQQLEILIHLGQVPSDSKEKKTCWALKFGCVLKHFESTGITA